MIMKNLFAKDNLDEIVFANRNKAYGAYALRNDYAKDLTRAVLIGVAFFASVAVIPLIVSAFSSDIVIEKVPDSDPFVLDPVQIAPEITKVSKAANIPPNIKTVINPEYNPVRDIKKDIPLPTKQDFEGAAIGQETKSGESTDIAYVPPIVTADPPAKVYAPATVAEDPDKIRGTSEVDVAADFKGGIDAFREKVAQNFDTEAVDKTGTVSGIITFVVEKDGSISNLKVSGLDPDFNAEAERTVKSIKTKWKPALWKGKAVRSSFRMPISMKIE